jgi:hypothetical protein
MAISMKNRFAIEAHKAKNSGIRQNRAASSSFDATRRGRFHLRGRNDGSNWHA